MPRGFHYYDDETSSGKAGATAGIRGQLSILTRLVPYLWPKDMPGFRVRVVLAFVALVAAKVALLLSPILLGRAVNALSAKTDNVAVLIASVPLSLIAAYGIARIGGVGFQQLRDILFARVGQFAQRRVAVEVFRHLHVLSLRFHLERRTGGLSRIIERGVKSIEFLLRFLVFSVGPTLIELALVATFLTVRYDWSYALVTSVTVILYVWFTFSVTEWRLQIRRVMNNRDTEANTRAVDSLLNYETVKYFGNEQLEADRYDQSMGAYQEAAIRSQISLGIVNGGQALIFNSGLAVLMGLAAYNIAKGHMDVGGFVTVNAMLIQLYGPLNMLGFVYREIKQALVDMEKMFSLLTVRAEVKDKPGAGSLKVVGGEIEFDRVQFAYDSRREILRGISFVAHAGQTLAIVGPSGAGKSTISRLAYRFYDPQAGVIRIDGQDIAAVTQDSLRRAIGIVPQDTVLFNESIAYNIAYAKPDAGFDEIVQAAKQTHIHRFIEALPDGYDTIVGERGLKLSGGEKQRVAIARTILKDPPILILDEATSALDSQTEQSIQKSLNEIAQYRTTLVIAHRLSTVRDADVILVLKDGRIVERGNHDDLMGIGGLYADMWQQQQRGLALGAEGQAGPQAEREDMSETATLDRILDPAAEKEVP